MPIRRLTSDLNTKHLDHRDDSVFYLYGSYAKAAVAVGDWGYEISIEERYGDQLQLDKKAVSNNPEDPDEPVNRPEAMSYIEMKAKAVNDANELLEAADQELRPLSVLTLGEILNGKQIITKTRRTL